MENSAPVPSIDQAELEKLKNTAKYFENLAFEYNANICALKNILEQKVFIAFY
jgi:hypothetical protein